MDQRDRGSDRPLQGQAGCRLAFGRRLAIGGFTLIEAMIVVAVIGLLAVVAVPAYSDYIRRGTLTEAFGVMTSYSLQLGQYYQDNRSFLNTCTTVGLPTSSHFTFSCPTQSANAYVVQATGMTGSNVAGFTFTLDNSGARSTTAAPTGWPTNTSCWVTSKAGVCQ